jgi:hypothetical protein
LNSQDADAMLEDAREEARKTLEKKDLITQKLADRLKLAHDAKEKEVLTALLHMRKIVESEEMLRETREDARKNLLKKITEKLNERLKLAQEAKEKDALIGLLMQKRAIESEEAVRETKEDAARRVMTRLLQRLADRLRLAHDAKEKEVLTALLLMKKVVEAEEENRRVREEAERVLEETREEARKSVLRKALQKLSDRLKLAHDAKEKEVLAGLLHMKKAVEAEEAVRETKEDAARRVLRKATMLLADRLKLAHDAKEKEVLLGLLLMKKAVQHEEDVRTLKEEADKVLEQTKAVDAEMLEDAREEARKTLEKKVLQKLADRLKLAHDAKEKEVLTALLHMRKIVESEEMLRETREDARKNLLKKITEKLNERLKLAQEAKEKDALIGLLMQKRAIESEEAVRETKEDAARRVMTRLLQRLADRLRLAHDAKEKEVLTALLLMKKVVEAEEENRRVREEAERVLEETREEARKSVLRKALQKLSDRLKLAHDAKEKEVLAGLLHMKKAVEAEEAVRETKEDAARRVLRKATMLLADRLKLAHDAKEKEVLLGLLLMKKAVQHEEDVRTLKEEADKVLEQTKAVDAEMLEDAREEARKTLEKKVLQKLADRLKLAHDAKEKEVLTALLHMRKIVESEEMLRETREDARKNLLKKITEKLNERLKLAQEAKEKDALIGLLMQKRAIESEEAVRETKEDAARRVMTRLLQRLADRLRLAHDAKEKEVLTALLLMKKVVEAEEENRRVREEAERVLEETREEARKSVLRKALQKLSDRLKLAHDAKEKEVLAGLLHMKKAVEAEEAVRETKEDAARRVLRKATMLLADRLKLAHDAKEKEVLLGLLLMKKAVQHEEDVRTLKEEADKVLEQTKAVDAEMLEDAREEARKTLEKKVLQKLADRLKLAHDAKEKEVLTALLHMRKIVESEEMLRETREDARKNLLKKITEKLNERLKLAQEAKEKDALIGLLMQKRAIESEEAVRETKEDAARRVMTRLLQRLADRLRLAHDAKEKEVLTALLLMKKVVEAEEENRRVREEAERVLEETREEARKSVLRKALQKLSDRLKLAHDAKEKEVLAGLLHMKKAVEAEEAVRETKEDAARRVLRKATMLLADRLKLAHDAKEKDLKLAQVAKAFHALTCLRDQKLESSFEDDLKDIREETDKRLLNRSLLKLADKLRSSQVAKKRAAFINLLTNNDAIQKLEQTVALKTDSAKRLMKKIVFLVSNRLKLAQKSKLAQAVTSLREWNQLIDFGQEMTRTQTEAARKYYKRITFLLYDRIKMAHDGKSKQVFNQLKDANTDMNHRKTLADLEEEAQKRLEKARQDRIKKIRDLAINRLILCKGAKLAEAINDLRHINNDYNLQTAIDQTKRELTDKLRQSKMKSAISKLLVAQKLKEINANNRLKTYFDKIVAIENVEMIKQTEFAIRKRKKTIEFLNRLKLAQEAKAIEALRNLLTLEKRILYDEETREITQKANEKLKRKKIQGLLTRLKLAQDNKEKQVLKTLKTVKNQVIAEENLKKTQDELNNQIKNKNIKNTGIMFKDASESKMKEVLNRMRDIAKVLINKEQNIKKQKRDILNSLIKACLTKTLDANDRLLHNFLNARDKQRINQLTNKLAQEKERNAMLFILEKLRKGQSAKSKQALKEIKAYNDYEKSIETLDSVNARHAKKLRIKLLLGLLNSTKNKQLFSLLSLSDFYKDAVAEENLRSFNIRIEQQKRKEKQRNFFAHLNAAQSAKKSEAVRSLQNNRANRVFEAETNLKNKQLRDQKINNITNLLLARILNKRDEAWYKLRQHGKEAGVDASLLKKNKLLNDLIRAQKAKQGLIYRKVVTMYRLQVLTEINERSSKHKFIRRLILAFDSKEKEALYEMQKYKNELVRQEREKKLNLRFFMEQLSEIGTSTKSKNREFCYLKMVAYTNEKNLREMIMKNSFGRLLMCHDAKIKNAAYLLRQNNLYHFGKDNLNHTLIEIETEKFLNIKRKMMKKFMRATNMKLLISMKELRYNNNRINERNAKGKMITEKLMRSATLNLASNRIRAYKRMCDYARKNKEYEVKYKNKLKYIVASMGKTNELNEKDALHRLINFNAKKERVVERIRVNKGNIINKILAGQNSKKLDALHRLRKFKDDQDVNRERRKVKLVKLINKLQNAQDGKQNGILSDLVEANRNYTIIAKHRKDKLTNIANRLLMAFFAKQLYGLTKLRLNLEGSIIDSKNENLIEKEKEMKQNKLLSQKLIPVRKLVAAQMLKPLDALDRLVSFNKERKRIEDKKRETIVFLMNKISAANALKTNDAFGKTRDNSKTVYINNEDKRKKQISLVSRLVNVAYPSKLLEAFNTLIKNKRARDLKEQKKRDILNYLLNKLVGSSQQKTHDALSKTRLNAKNQYIQSEERRRKQANLLARLTREAYPHKLHDALTTLTRHNQIAKEANRRRQDRLALMLSRIVGAHTAKEKDAISNLRDWRDEFLEKSSRIQEKLRFLIVKMEAGKENKIRSALDILREINRHHNIMDEQYLKGVKNFLNKLRHGHEGKLKDAIHNLRQSPARPTDRVDRLKILRVIIGQTERAARGKVGEAVQRLRIVREVQTSILRRTFERIALAQYAKAHKAVESLQRQRIEGVLDDIRLSHLKYFLGNTLLHSSRGILGFSGVDNMRIPRLQLDDKNMRPRGSIGNLPAELQGFAADGPSSSRNRSEVPSTPSSARPGHNFESDEKGQRGVSVGKNLGDVTPARSSRPTPGGLSDSGISGISRSGVGRPPIPPGRGAYQQSQVQTSIWVGQVDDTKLMQKKTTIKQLGVTKLLLKLAKAQKEKEIDAVARITHFTKELATKQERLRLAQKKLASRLLQGQSGKVRESVIVMRHNVVKVISSVRVDKMTREKVIADLFTAQERKRDNTFHYLTEKAKMNRERLKRIEALKKMVVSKLYDNLGGLQGEALHKLQNFNNQISQKKVREEKLKRILINNLTKGSQGKEKQTLQKMIAAKNTLNEKLNRASLIRNRLMTKILESGRAQMHEAISKLKSNSLEVECRKLRREMAMIKLIDSLDHSYRTKVVEAHSYLRINREVNVLRADRLRIRTQFLTRLIVEKLSECRIKEIGRAFDQLHSNALQYRLRQEKLRNVLQRLVHNQELKQLNAASKLRLQTIQLIQKERERGEKLRKIATKCYNKTLRYAYTKLVRDETDRLSKFIDFMHEKMRLNKQYGYLKLAEALKNSRREGFMKGINRLAESYRRMAKVRKSEGYFEIKRQFYNDNPWFKRAVTKMTVGVPCGVQVAFWRIRTERDFGGALLPVEQSIKLKRLSEIVERRKTMMMRQSLTLLEIGRVVLTDSGLMMNSSFISMRNTATPVQNRSDSRQRNKTTRSTLYY